MKIRYLLSLSIVIPTLAFAASNSDELIAQEQALRSGKVSASEILKKYQGRIAQWNPQLHAVISLDPQADVSAQQIDRKKNHKAALAGLPILIKDNIDVQGMVTTAGSLALAENLQLHDAPVVARLRAAGAIIVGKANLSEWANMRSSKATSGWSGVGGQARNPYAPDRSPCGSSSGSAAAVAVRMIPAAIGSETDGSIVCPAAVNGLVGLKPTVGLVSRTGIVPISHSQDTAGPITLTVKDAAMLLNVMAGSDPRDAATKDADSHRSRNYLAGLIKSGLKGKRLGVIKKLVEVYDPETKALFEKTLAVLKGQGAIIIEVPELPNSEQLEKDELTVLLCEFKDDLNAYLATTPTSVKTRTMADIIAFNKEHADKEMPYFDQDLMEQAQATGGLSDPAYLIAITHIKQQAGRDGIDAMMRQHKLDAFIAPTTGPAWPIDYHAGDVIDGSSSTPAAIAGYPDLTVPMGVVRNLPVGLSFFGAAWSEASLLKLGYAFEQSRPAIPQPELIAKP